MRKLGFVITGTLGCALMATFAGESIARAQYQPPPPAQPPYPQPAPAPYAPMPQPQQPAPYAPPPQYAPAPPQAPPQYAPPPPAYGQQQQPPPPQYGQPQPPQIYAQPPPAPVYGQPQPPPAYGQQLPPPQYGPSQQPYPPRYPQQPPPMYPPPTGMPPPSSDARSNNEMVFLYGTTFAYGVGTGVWIDSLARVGDPGLAVLAPIAFGAAAPIGAYFYDNAYTFHRGVPSSISTGLTLGALEGLAISGTQWQHTRDDHNQWEFSTQTTVTWLMATAGGIGGYAFGEWLRPDPRSLGFIASGAGWGAISGTLFGAGASGSNWGNGASVGGLLGYNVGIVATGALSTVYTPSWESQKWMWTGFAAGTAVTSLVYVFYIDDAHQAKHGLIANAVGGLGGVAIAGVLTANIKDAPGSASWTPPFQIGFAPTGTRGALVNASGTW